MRNLTADFITKIADGATVTEKRTPLFVTEKSVKGAEFYTAYQSGIDADVILECDPDSFKFASGTNTAGKVFYPSEVEFNGNRKVIIRSYKINGKLELTIGRGKR